MSKDFEEHKFEAFMDFLNSDEPHLPFDPHAQDSNDWTWLQEFIPTIIISSAGGMIPFQVTGLIQGLPFYYRERGGWASLRVAEEDAADAYGNRILYEAGEEVEEGQRGHAWLSTIMNLVENLERSMFLYQFKAKKLEFSDPHDHRTAYSTEEDEIIRGWGHTPQEAYEQTREVDSYLLSVGWTAEEQMRLWEMNQIENTPLNVDDRVFPDPEPVFSVRVPEMWRNDEGRIEIPDEFWEAPADGE